MITFIVGTDTGVGKTYYGKILAKQGNTVIKPIETGSKSFSNINESDSYSYSIIQGKDIKDINLYFFTEPLSPHIAGEIDGIKIDIEKMKGFIQRDEDIFVELAGGLMVPLTRN
jgi:dethiobiotin synthetase